MTAADFQSLPEKLREFFENGKLAQSAAESIKNGREIEITVSAADGSDDLVATFTKEGGKNKLLPGEAKSPDLRFQMTQPVAEELVTRKFSSIAEVGVFLLEKITSSDPKHKVSAKLNAGLLGFLAGGYVGVLLSGGTDLAKFLASKGISIAKIKDILAKYR